MSKNTVIKYKKQYGFTLAEVLITLLIIGVVASLIIPSILNDTRDAELKTAWKKTYASINQAFGEILMDNGGTFIGIAGDSNEFRNAFKNKMNFVSKCDGQIACDSQSLTKLNGTSDSYILVRNLILNDGTIIYFFLDSGNCDFGSYVYTSGACGWILVDVNGNKNPNRWGKDIYGIWVMKNQILPWGADPAGTANSTYKESTCISSGSGYGCGAKYLYN